MARSRGQCERCGGRAEHVHHLTYERLGDEDLCDLQALCIECHRLEHPHMTDTRPKRKYHRIVKAALIKTNE